MSSRREHGPPAWRRIDFDPDSVGPRVGRHKPITVHVPPPPGASAHFPEMAEHGPGESEEILRTGEGLFGNKVPEQIATSRSDQGMGFGKSQVIITGTKYGTLQRENDSVLDPKPPGTRAPLAHERGTAQGYRLQLAQKVASLRRVLSACEKVEKLLSIALLSNQ